MVRPPPPLTVPVPKQPKNPFGGMTPTVAARPTLGAPPTPPISSTALVPFHPVPPKPAAPASKLILT